MSDTYVDQEGELNVNFFKGGKTVKLVAVKHKGRKVYSFDLPWNKLRLWKEPKK